MIVVPSLMDISPTNYPPATTTRDACDACDKDKDNTEGDIIYAA